MADIDQRIPDNSAPIWRKTKSLTIADGTNNGQTAAFGLNGVLTTLLVTIPALTQTTCTITIVDEDGNTLFTSDALTESGTRIVRTFTGPNTIDVPLRAPMCGAVYVKGTVDTGNETGDKVVGVVLLGE